MVNLLSLSANHTIWINVSNLRHRSLKKRVLIDEHQAPLVGVAVMSMLFLQCVNLSIVSPSHCSEVVQLGFWNSVNADVSAPGIFRSFESK